MAKNLVDGENIVIEEDGNNINFNFSNNVNKNLNVYSTEETVTGTWVNQKPIYKKAIYINSLPNNTTGSYQTGITNMESLINMYGIYQGTAEGIRTTRPLNFFDYTIQQQNITTFYASTNNTIRIKTFYDWSALSGYVILEYTKTTD